MDALRPSADLWWDDQSRDCPWVFRGHGDASWELLPAAWRSNCHIMATAREEAAKRFDRVRPRQELRWMWGNHVSAEYSFDVPNITELKRSLTIEATAEWLPVWDFIARCDALGMHNPFGSLPPDNDSPDWLCDPGLPLISDEYSVRYSNTLPTLALAQHHKIPTRLLDWTRNPLTAAYFAAESRHHNTELAVWALHRRNAAEVKTKYEFPDGPNLRDVHVHLNLAKISTMGNPFLAAQSGLFTSISGSGIYFLENIGIRPSIERFVSEMKPPSTVLRKMVLPLEEFEELQSLLKREGVLKSALMPTMDNVAEEVLSRWNA